MPFSRSYLFKQRDYRLKLGIHDLEGLCVSLVGKWCQLMLSDSKDKWSNPNSSAEKRFGNFFQKDTYQTIAQEQRVSFARLTRMGTATQGLEMMVEVAKIMRERVDVMERQPLIDAAIETDAELKVRGDTIPRQVLSKFGCSNVSQPTTVIWSNLATGFETKHCYAIIFVTQSGQSKGQHAIGVYMSGGFFNYDYHIFDPNCGEYKATDAASAQRFLDRLSTTYGNPREARVFRMQL
ncbi:hypothetical protein VP02_03075 [Pseudomonas ogarae]|uniref:Virulence surface antigen n=1 Tax=Pseudomonas kilonensis TaxID=132476 RepID=A0A0F4XUM1_9PSED|nr:hypothetical protein [Pseudomonas ogarae]KKA09515.1 hypothetical protein VP02_03075 [Pseudomonas ogarae]